MARHHDGSPLDDAEVDNVLDRARERLVYCGLWRATDLGSVTRRVRELTGRRVELTPMQLSHRSLHGLLVSTADVDYVVYEENTSRFHQEHIILHELSHQLWGHQGQIVGGGAGESIDPRAWSEPVEVLGRSGYLDRQECEAEVMASLLGQSISSGPQPTHHPGLARVLRSFDLGSGE
ncbi:ImmA/IrrE family metallo-endopeptidase [Gordonia sinesedis]